MNITSDYGSFNFPHFYLGWRNIHRPTVRPDDCGDEIFGLAIGNLYVGYYEDGKWCAGVLDDNGCLN